MTICALTRKKIITKLIHRLRSVLLKGQEEKKEMRQIENELEDEKMSEAQRSLTASKNKDFISSDTKDAADFDEKKKP